MLSIFTRYPEAGTTKTRLIPALGAEAAASLQQAMTRHVLSVAGRVARDRGQPLEIRYAGGILLFLHADTRLPGGFQQRVRHALALPGVIGGAFRFRVDADGRGFRALERWTNWRARVLQMPYGDQALFMKATTFEAMNGFPVKRPRG